VINGGVPGKVGETLHIRVRESSTTAESRYGFDQHIDDLLVPHHRLRSDGGIGCLGLMTTMSLQLLDRPREMGALRAMLLVSRPLTKVLGGHVSQAVPRGGLHVRIDWRGDVAGGKCCTSVCSRMALTRVVLALLSEWVCKSWYNSLPIKLSLRIVY
jgi:hypothetical protein